MAVSVQSTRIDRSLIARTTHTRKRRMDRDGVSPDGGEPGEFVCPVCGYPCTRSRHGVEYGHSMGHGNRWEDRDNERCPRRPESVDTSRAGGHGGVWK